MDNSWRSAAIKESLIAFIATTVICGIINFFISSPMNGTELGETFVLPILLTAIIIIIINIFLKRAMMKKGSAHSIPNNRAQASYVFVPNHPLAFLVAYTIISLLLIGFAAAGIFGVFFAELVFPHLAVVAISSVLTGLAAFYVSYHCNVFLASYYGERYASAA